MKPRKVHSIFARNAHPTKRGPGRRHGQGEPHGRRPSPPKGGDWIGQYTNGAAAAEKLLKRTVGARQARIMTKARRRGVEP